MSDGNSSSSARNDSTNNPLFGAPPPSSASDNITSQSPPMDDATASSSTLEGTTNPLFGATPPQYSRAPWQTPMSYDQPIPRELRLYHPPRPNPPSKTIQFVKRITFILSLFLGISSTIAGIWSIFLLPLLHSSFSARKAIVDPQLDRVNKLVEGLRKIRALDIYPKPTQVKKESEEEEDVDGGESGNEGIRREASLKELSSSMTSLIPSDEDAPSSSHTPSTPTQIIPYEGLSSLTFKLKSLTSALEATSTTRTSLISTLESYTSSIHRQLFISRPTTSGYSSYSIGMNSLSNHLGQSTSKDSSTGDNFGLGGVKNEDWDNTRKEIRAIKGLLLNRRQFVGAK